MRRILATVAMLVLLAPSAMAGTRVETKNYLGGSGDFLVACGATPSAAGDLGGACFSPRPSDAEVGLWVDDAAAPHVSAYYILERNGNVLAEGRFCDGTHLTLPGGRGLLLYVFVEESFAALYCADAAPATEGTITAVFRN